MSQLRVLIADDHPLFRHGIHALLAATSDLVAVGEARTGEEAVRLTGSLRPDLVLMDLHMPVLNGVDATRQILHTNPATHILMVTMFEDDSSVFAAMRAGARGYILKDADRPDMLRAIRAVGSGEAIFSPAVATRLIHYFSVPPQSAPAVGFPELTQREREILDLIAQGHGNQDIARCLMLSHSTVRNYVSSIFSKLQVADRSHAIVRAREGGLG